MCIAIVLHVLHLHCHLAGEVILQCILTAVGVVPIQAEGGPVLRRLLESATQQQNKGRERAHHGVDKHDVVFGRHFDDTPEDCNLESKGIIHRGP